MMRTKRMRRVALVVLFSSVFSTSSPLLAAESLDAREERLKLKEAELHEREIAIPLAQIDIGERQEELERWKAELEQLAEDIRQRGLFIPAKESELEDREANLNRQKAELDNRDDKVKQHENLLAEKEFQLNEQEAKLTQKKTELDSVAEEIRQRSLELPLREIELDDQRAKLERKESELVAAKEQLDQDHAKIAQTMNELGEQKESLDRWASDLRNDEKRLSLNMERIAQKEQEISEFQDSLEQRRAHLTKWDGELMAEAEKLETDKKVLIAGKEELEDAKAKLAVAKADMENRDIAVTDREVKVAKREADVTEREQRENFELAAAKEELKRQEQRVADKEKELKVKAQDFIAQATELEKKSAELAKTREELDRVQTALNKEQAFFASAQTMIKGLDVEVANATEAASAAKLKAEKEAARADVLFALSTERQHEIGKLNAALVMAKEMLMANMPMNVVLTTVDNGVGQGTMNWSEDYIEAMGMAPLAQDKAKNAAQGLNLARRGAILDLQRNLLETVKGVQINAETKMENFMTTDSVRSAVNGTIKGVEVFEQKNDGENYVVKGRIRLNAIRAETAKKISGKRIKDPKGVKSSFTGLILDARHLPLEPTMFFRIVDENGKPVYGIEFADKDRQAQSGLCSYYDRIVYAKDESKVGKNPLVVKAQKLTNGNKDIVIPNSAAAQIRGSRPDFRKTCSVIIVKS